MLGKLGFGSPFSNSFGSLAPVSPRLAASALGLFVLMAVEIRADKVKPVAPRGKDIAVEVMRGGSVQIPLRGFERNLNRLVYRPLGGPRYGTLSNLRQHEGRQRQGAGEITYTHGNDDDSTTDTFAYEVRSPLTNLRGRGRVTIRILDAAPKLQVSPSMADFGTSALGDPPARGTIELENAGGGLLQGYLDPPAPFRLEEDGSFVLRRGESTRISILFAPERPGPYVFRVQPVPGDPTMVTLRGEALSPFFVEVPDPVFVVQPDKSRTATVEIRNSSQRSRMISILPPQDSPVVRPPVVKLAPGEESEITLRIPPDYKAAVGPFEVKFESAGHTQTQEFTAPAHPPELAVAMAPDFGPVSPGTVAHAELVLRNDGGMLAEARLVDHESISPANGTPAIGVPAGEELAVPLKLRLKKNQALPESFTVSFRNREIDVPIKASLAAQAAPMPAPVPTPSPTPAWTLNEDIYYLQSPEGPVLAWRVETGDGDLELQHRPDGTGSWRAYRMPSPQVGWFDWFRGLARRVESFLTTEIKRPQIGESAADEGKTKRRPIDQANADRDVWRLAALRHGEDGRVLAGPFRIEGSKLVAVEDLRSPDPAEASTPRLPSEGNRIKARAFAPETAMASAGINADRNTALLQAAFAAELGIGAFRLEQGAMVSAIDPVTGIPRAPEFQKIEPPQYEVELLGMTEGEADGKQFTICLARIDGLPAGTRTYWRIVPSGDKGELPPAAVLLVDTKPLPPFPWNILLLSVLFALLAGVLWLRWRIRRIPR